MYRIQVWLEADALYESKSGLFYYSPTYSSVSRDMSVRNFFGANTIIENFDLVLWWAGQKSKTLPGENQTSQQYKDGFYGNLLKLMSNLTKPCSQSTPASASKLRNLCRALINGTRNGFTLIVP